MTTASELMTAEEFQVTHDPPGRQSELIRGEVVFLPLMFPVNSAVAVHVSALLDVFVERHRLGHSTGFGGYCLCRDPDTVRAPDSAWIAFERLPGGELPDDVYIDAAPNLAVEVISARDREADIDEKVSDWLSAGAERVWVVRPRQRSVTVHRPNGDSHRYTAQDTLTSDDAAFPVEGFELPVAQIFE